ncbi:MAG: 4Fe-4S cluster-binding domain-containing protein [Chloroflexi bacterium]|nr:4Fe-4S cluster-binding domain-containing protein [Chloroflexota bacterium]
MRISEIFYSIQGEGIYTGLPMVFVRFQGCPFQCAWCDTEYTWDFGGGSEMGLDAVTAQIAQWPAKRVCVTGGEPLAHARDFAALAQALNEQGYWIEVETAGGHRLPMDLPIDCWVMDIKCPGSGMDRFNKYGEVASLRSQDQLKFVVTDRADFDFALGVIQEHRPVCHILFAPVWESLAPADLTEWVKDESVDARVSLQVHKLIWDPSKRGV